MERNAEVRQGCGGEVLFRFGSLERAGANVFQSGARFSIRDHARKVGRCREEVGSHFGGVDSLHFGLKDGTVSSDGPNRIKGQDADRERSAAFKRRWWNCRTMYTKQ